MNIISFKNKNYFYKNIFSVDENGREINIYNYENCLVTGINVYYPNVLLKTKKEWELVFPLLERTMSLQSNSIYEKSNMKFPFIEKEIIHSCETPLFFFIYNTDNYFHFLYDSLPYLISYFELKKEFSELKLLVQYPNDQKKDFYPFILEFLDIFGILNENIVLVNENTIYKSIFISTSYTHDIDSNLPPRKEIYDFYQNIVALVYKKYQITNLISTTPKKIYVSRRTWKHNNFSNIGTNYTTRRKLVNEDELVEKLVEDGYKEVFTENLTTMEKIVYFSNATHVVGAIGGGISNVLFSPKTTKLEVLVSPTFLEVNKRFKYSLECVDVNYNFNSEHVEKSEFKTYMRVKCKEGNIIGEIEKINEESLLISYTDGSNTGWNAENIYKQMEVNMEDVEKLDNGLNSPWTTNFYN